MLTNKICSQSATSRTRVWNCNKVEPIYVPNFIQVYFLYSNGCLQLNLILGKKKWNSISIFIQAEYLRRLSEYSRLELMRMSSCVRGVILHRKSSCFNLLFATENVFINAVESHFDWSISNNIRVCVFFLQLNSKSTRRIYSLSSHLRRVFIQSTHVCTD